MAYYDKLIAHWPSVSGSDTASKLANLNAEIVTGTVQAVFFVTGAQLFNAIDITEFNALTAAQQMNLLNLCSIQGNLTGGATSFLGKLFVSYFTNLIGPTITNLTALAKSLNVPWWVANGYPRTFDLGDIAAAGLS